MNQPTIRLEDDVLYIDGSAFQDDEPEVFDVDIRRLSAFRLKDVPLGYAVRICRQVIGGKELFSIEPHATFHHLTEQPPRPAGAPHCLQLRRSLLIRHVLRLLDLAHLLAANITWGFTQTARP